MEANSSISSFDYKQLLVRLPHIRCVILKQTAVFNFLHFLQGDIQQLQLVPSPEAAYEQCIDFIPDCDSPLPYSRGPEDTVFPVYPSPRPDVTDDDDEDDDDDFPDYTDPDSGGGIYSNYTPPVCVSNFALY